MICLKPEALDSVCLFNCRNLFHIFVKNKKSGIFLIYTVCLDNILAV